MYRHIYIYIYVCGVAISLVRLSTPTPSLRHKIRVVAGPTLRQSYSITCQQRSPHKNIPFEDRRVELHGSCLCKRSLATTIYIYIYMYRDASMCIYIYIHIMYVCIHIHIYIYIYIYIYTYGTLRKSGSNKESPVGHWLENSARRENDPGVFDRLSEIVSSC